MRKDKIKALFAFDGDCSDMLSNGRTYAEPTLDKTYHDRFGSSGSAMHFQNGGKCNLMPDNTDIYLDGDK